MADVEAKPVAAASPADTDNDIGVIWGQKVVGVKAVGDDVTIADVLDKLRNAPEELEVVDGMELPGDLLRLPDDELSVGIGTPWLSLYQELATDAIPHQTTIGEIRKWLLYDVAASQRIPRNLSLRIGYTGPSAEMALVIKRFTGEEMHTVVDSSIEVLLLKMLLEQQQGTPADAQRLIYGVQEMVDTMRLSEFSVEDNGVVLLVPYAAKPEENQGERLMMLPEQRRSEADADNAVPITVTVRRLNGDAHEVAVSDGGWQVVDLCEAYIRVLAQDETAGDGDGEGGDDDNDTMPGPPPPPLHELWPVFDHRVLTMGEVLSEAGVVNGSVVRMLVGSSAKTVLNGMV